MFFYSPFMGFASGSGGGGGGITLVSLATTTRGMSSSTQNLNVPTGIQEGDLLLVVSTRYANNLDTDAEAVTYSTITGNNSGAYTKEVAIGVNGTDTDGILGVSYKIQGATVDTSITINGAPFNNTDLGEAYTIFNLRGVDSTTPIDVTTVTSKLNGAATTMTPPDITPTTSGALIVVCAATGYNTEPTRSWNSVSELENFQAIISDQSVIDAYLGVGTFPWVSGTYSPEDLGISNTATSNAPILLATLAIRPAT